jgi:hypothetical protein
LFSVAWKCVRFGYRKLLLDFLEGGLGTGGDDGRVADALVV